MNVSTSADGQHVPVRQALQQWVLRPGVSWPGVKHGLTFDVNRHLACAAKTWNSLGAMYDEDGNFTEAHLREMGKRMDQSIRMARKNKSQVATEIGVSRAAMTQYCSGQSTPSLQNMARFCREVKIPMDYIVFGTTPELEEQMLPVLQEMIASRNKKKGTREPSTNT